MVLFKELLLSYLKTTISWHSQCRTWAAVASFPIKPEPWVDDESWTSIYSLEMSAVWPREGCTSKTYTSRQLSIMFQSYPTLCMFISCHSYWRFCFVRDGLVIGAHFIPTRFGSTCSENNIYDIAAIVAREPNLSHVVSYCK